MFNIAQKGNVSVLRIATKKSIVVFRFQEQMFYCKHLNARECSDEFGYHIGDKKLRFNDQGVHTDTTAEQREVEASVDDVFMFSEPCAFEFQRQNHINYMLKHVQSLSFGYSSQEASRTWFCFWILHSLRMLGYKLTEDQKKQFIAFLKSCEHKNGGYGGAPGQYAHMATTYAAVMALVSIGTEEALASIDRTSLIRFFHEMRQSDGSFQMHEGGEIDVRAVYCSVAVTFVLNICGDKLFEDTGLWLAKCQTYEGGFGGAPECEAHGGYTLCGAASLIMLDKPHLMDVDGLARWLCMRQMSYEGGFQGRSGKLVDACYSYWVGAAALFVDQYLANEDGQTGEHKARLFNPTGLQQYVAFVSQVPTGGFRDKPRKPSDIYHTCYALAGLSIAQHYSGHSHSHLQGGAEALLEKINVLLNVTDETASFAMDYFKNRPL